jgi:hypothetical protein
MTNTNTPLPTNIGFGWFLTSALAIAGAYCYFKLANGILIGFGLFIIALLIALVTLFIPKLLTPLNKAWFLLGELLGKIISPLVLGIIFFLIITPTAIIGRALGRDELKLRRKSQSSYWIDRKSPSPRGDSFNNQF